MELPTYTVDPKAETGWVAVAGVIGAAVTGICAAFGVETETALIIGGAVAVTCRFVIGLILPSSKPTA